MTDFSTITACGECCTGCPKKPDGRCPGCIESDGFVPEWAESGRCKVHACTREHHPTAYGAFEGPRLIGFVEGFLEKWNNRYRISNICVFDHADRRSGVGMKMMEIIMNEAVRSGARMVVLETQTFNYKAISFYKKNGFHIIGFDRYAYSNNGPEEHNMRIEMGKKLQD